jgi:DUF4097 and DUF4098 domain-containing protein YvlB
MKKYILIVAVILSTVASGYSQKTINKRIEVDGQETEMKLSFADDIILEAWNNNYIEIQVAVDIDNNKYNDYYSLDVDADNTKIEILEEVNFEEIKKLNGNKKHYNFNTTINYTLKVPRELKIKLETISGEIELIGCLGEMSINSISGFIDYSIPQSHNVNIELSTVTGDVYSNVTFDKKASDKISWVGTNQELSLNGGNTEVDLKTVSGDIYLRKY